METGRPVLVVDDDVTTRATLADILALAGYPVETAADGSEALQAVERARPSLVVTDVHMPNMDGQELVQELRARGFDPPVLVITGTVRNPGQVVESMGADDCLLKPFDVGKLLQAIERLRCP